MKRPIAHESLLTRVADQLRSIGTGTDYLLLTRWRVLQISEYLLVSRQAEAEQFSVKALKAFSEEGVSASTDEALSEALAAIARVMPANDGSVLPRIAPSKREEVLEQLRHYEQLEDQAIRNALPLLAGLRERLRQSPPGPLLAGIRHRLELVAGVAQDKGNTKEGRIKAAAAILYLNELHDVIPDTLGHIGLLDDDFALRIVLDELGKFTEEEVLHWSERISALWDELPFLQGVRLNREGDAIAVTWLDRINSYLSYLHALDRDRKPLVLVQPSVACSPMHSMVTLIGLLVLEGLTSSHGSASRLREGQVYEVDGKFLCRYEGVFTSPEGQEYLVLSFREEKKIFVNSVISRRMVPVFERELSTLEDFSAETPWNDAEPIQRFFGWAEAIGAGSISARIVLVTTRLRAKRMFRGVRSNNVGLLNDGLIQFAGLDPDPEVLRSGLVLVVPNLSVARQLLAQELDIYSIIVDGYRRLHRGRHDLPFLMRRASPPSVIVWSSSGYYPTKPPEWLPDHRHVEVFSEDLAQILDLDDEIDDTMSSSRASLWEAATTAEVRMVLVELSAEEQTVLEAIDAFFETVHQSPELPEFWQYHLRSSASKLRSLITATPAYFLDIREMAMSWKAAFDERWTTLHSHTAEALQPVAESHERMFQALGTVSAERNTKAEALLRFLVDEGEKEWRLVCDHSQQVTLVGRFKRKSELTAIKPVRLRDLSVCRPCIAVGWRKVSFGRRVLAHTPCDLVAVVSEEEAQRWKRLLSQAHKRSGDSILEAVGHRPRVRNEPTRPPSAEPLLREMSRCEHSVAIEEDSSLAPCVFLWLADEPEGRILARDARVLMEVGDRAKERHAASVKPEDRIILGPGSSRWSPADEFTNSVVRAVEDAHPRLVEQVKEWRVALERLVREEQWSVETLRFKLADVGVTREIQTLEGWLRLDQSAPIGPQHINRELAAIWRLVGGSHTQNTFQEVAKACSRLRSLRSDSCRALLMLWKGKAVNLGIDQEWLKGLVERLREEVEVHEVDAVTFGRVPEAMLGWWVSSELASRYEVAEPDDSYSDSEDIASEDD